MAAQEKENIHQRPEENTAGENTYTQATREKRAGERAQADLLEEEQSGWRTHDRNA